MNFIKWFVLLMRKDMQNCKMDENTNKSIYKQIMDKVKRDGGKIK